MDCSKRKAKVSSGDNPSREEEIEAVVGHGGDLELQPDPQTWWKHLTPRGLAASVAIGVMYSVVSMKLNLSTGLVPTLNVSAALLAFVILRTWTGLVRRVAGVVYAAAPFTPQENTVVQTCAVACYSISMGGGFGSYLLGLNKRTYELAMAGVQSEGNSPGSYKEPGLAWMIAFMFATSFVGLLALVPLRKIMIIDHKLVYPSGTATAVLINGFHTSQGDQISREQVHGFAKYFTISFLWSFFQWFFSGVKNCGVPPFQIFGMEVLKKRFFYDFSMTYVGAGMICSHLVNVSLLFGAVLSWGIMWPLLRSLKGQWYPEALPESSMRSLQGYKVFLSIALILGDGFYNFSRTIFLASKNLILQLRNKDFRKVSKKQEAIDLDNHQHNEFFIKENIPLWLACSGYVTFAFISTIIIPFIFPEVKSYYVAISYIFAPALSFSNAYGAGLTDMNMAYNYGKVALFILSGLAGKGNGVIAGMVGCGLIKSVVSISADLMHDFKTGHLTLTSPRAMLVSQAVGTAIGCIVAPLTFFLFYNAFDIGNPDGSFKAPYALIYRNMAILGVEGFSALPQNCLLLCYIFFGSALLSNIMKDFSPTRYGKWIPLPMVMAVPFLVGARFAIDMCVGSLVVVIYQHLNSEKATQLLPAVASGLICGDGLWTLFSSMLALAKVNPPICMKFFDT